MAKFCSKCGARLDERTGLCPNCNAKKLNKFIKIQKKEIQSKNGIFKINGRSWKVFLLLFILLLIAIVIIFLAIHNKKIDYSTLSEEREDTLILEETEDNNEPFKVEGPEAKSYFKEKAAKIVTVIDVNDSNESITEEDTYNALYDRGFQKYPITSEYSMDGEYSDASEITSSSSEKHPIYQTYYVSTSGDIWTIFVINGQVIANPVSYNLQSDSVIQVLISEDKMITSYDSVSNSFYQTIPQETELNVKVVDKIDVETLEKLSVEVIDTL